MSDFPEIYDKDRIEEMYKKRGFPNEKRELLKEYFTAFAEFYYIIPLNDAFKIIRQHNGDLISEEEFNAFAEIEQHNGYCFYSILNEDIFDEETPLSGAANRLIVHECLVMDDDPDDYYRVAELHSKKPMYIPEKSALLNYADDDYYEKSPQSNALTDFFRNKMGMDTEQAQEMTVECLICITCAFIPIESPMEAVFSDFERMQIKFTKLQLDEFRRLLCDLINNTRLPCNRGFTPNELARRFGMGEINSIAAVSAANSDTELTPREIGLTAVQLTYVRQGEKIGRNDPCPCGSGKKYKKCCGR